MRRILYQLHLLHSVEIRLHRLSLGCFCLLAFLAVPCLGAVAVPVPGQPPPSYTLDDCLQLALERNPTILKAQKDIERTQGVVITAKSTLYPHLSLDTRIEERDNDLFRQGTYLPYQGFHDFWIVQLYVTQSLYSGGVNRQQIAIAKLQHEASLVQFQATIDEVVKEVKYAVYAIVVDQAQIDAEQKTIALLGKEIDRQKSLFTAGRTTRFNVLRTEVSQANQSSQLSQSETDLTSAQIALSQLLDITWARQASPFNPPFAVREALDCPPVGKIKIEDLVGLALSRRPELQVIDRQIDIAERQIKIDKAANIPRIDLYLTDQELRDQNKSSFNDSINAYAFGLLGTWNVFDGFSSRGQVVSDKATLGSTHISRDQMSLQVQNEVREAYARLLIAQQTVQAQEANVKTAEESVGLAQVSADTGYATLLDVLQATLDLTTARTQEIKTKQLYMNALADLERDISLKFVDWPKDASAPEPTPTLVPAPVPAPPPAPVLPQVPAPTPKSTGAQPPR